MKHIYRAASALVLAVAGACAQAAPSITAVYGVGGAAAGVSDIANNGAMAGYTVAGANTVLPTYWTTSGQAVQLGLLGGVSGRALGLNESGQIVGYVTLADDTVVGARWSSDGSGVWVPSATSGFVAKDINEAGQIAYGDYNGARGASAINDAGASTGAVWGSKGPEPVVWGPGGSVTPLPTPWYNNNGGIFEGGTAEGLAINSHGLVAGEAHFSFQIHAVAWKDGQARRLLSGDVSYGSFAGGSVGDVNEQDQIVGGLQFYGPNSTYLLRAFLWLPYERYTQAIDLDAASGARALGWELQSAAGINDVGQVVGYGRFNGVTTAYLLQLSVVPEAGTAWMLGLGSVALLALRRRRAG